MTWISQAQAGVRDPFGHESISVSNAAIGFSDVYVYMNTQTNADSKASRAYVTVESNSIRVRWDGSDPTAAAGHKLNSGDAIEVLGEAAVQQFKMIRVSADAVVFVTYGKKNTEEPKQTVEVKTSPEKQVVKPDDIIEDSIIGDDSQEVIGVETIIM